MNNNELLRVCLAFPPVYFYAIVSLKKRLPLFSSLLMIIGDTGLERSLLTRAQRITYHAVQDRIEKNAKNPHLATNQEARRIAVLNDLDYNTVDQYVANYINLMFSNVIKSK